jgi:hypothetical protein
MPRGEDGISCGPGDDPPSAIGDPAIERRKTLARVLDDVGARFEVIGKVDHSLAGGLGGLHGHRDEVPESRAQIAAHAGPVALGGVLDYPQLRQDAVRQSRDIGQTPIGLCRNRQLFNREFDERLPHNRLVVHVAQGVHGLAECEKACL